ncbi:hypothetical protein [Pseudomonas asiatica]|uniref:hypothetical protein n=1 Tax=Pseudomonas asiatica TaxID=2219225 RepID=UPI003B938475
MNATFDDLILILSTDSFCGEILDTTTKHESLKIREIARKIVKTIINGGDNYYMCADFSCHRIKKTEKDFFELAQKNNIPKQTLEKIDNLHKILKSNSDETNTASYVINSIASRLYWLVIDEFNTPITPELLELIPEIEPLGLDVKHYACEWRDVWLESQSDWDKYIMSLMDGIDEAPYLTFTKLKSNLAPLDFLRKWNTHLGPKKFSHIKNFINTEAHHELDKKNARAAEKIDTLINSL